MQHFKTAVQTVVEVKWVYFANFSTSTWLPLGSTKLHIKAMHPQDWLIRIQTNSISKNVVRCLDYVFPLFMPVQSTNYCRRTLFISCSSAPSAPPEHQGILKKMGSVIPAACPTYATGYLPELDRKEKTITYLNCIFSKQSCRGILQSFPQAWKINHGPFLSSTLKILKVLTSIRRFPQTTPA